VEEQLTFLTADATQAPPPAPAPGLMVLNPPYAERMGSEENVTALYQALGANWKAHYEGWKIAMFTGNLAAARQMPLEANGKYVLNNGPLQCRLLMFEPGLEPVVAPASPETSGDGVTVETDDSALRTDVSATDESEAT